MNRIKICGLRRAVDIEHANSLRPDYIGFVFAPSKRQVTPGEAAALRASLDPAITPVGVFVNKRAETVAALVRSGTIDVVQLHGDEDAAYIAYLKALTGVPVIKAVRVGNALPEVPAGADFALYDTLTPLRGGSGESFDWTLLRRITAPYFLSGGIGPHNIDAALSELNPYCVDMSSSVETGGVKDYQKMKQMIESVRRSAG